jgi:hypothetical protein
VWAVCTVLSVLARRLEAVKNFHNLRKRAIASHGKSKSLYISLTRSVDISTRIMSEFGCSPRRVHPFFIRPDGSDDVLQDADVHNVDD